ncbi:MAG: 4-oxalocrotonate tautomerase [Candidatus Methanofastidiosum methylothiophilum]|jgi:4-oxalocrotonate tautomerase|uniref:4-oxalocrotonate tautomerase n=1 Tax=Candidatus Methanofastidiosum methylothiophilum TaxID=1705564 RepID=A0A150JCN5_9EURY|nr:MAG: 4-oxalocrotonate tautomerase [Candidatus Methanofastidiosum methylthiophilus]OQC49915.1 MAG: 4-oxalocrotonate tautomerase [Euryarchaeota archaeon ADurb.Bin023]HOE93188.1 tautomerase family protein [Methanofastidiosum sp.]KYC56626.1 MAG: 4-oxalocrotonate tautomerase [Candidatus Methanofastidiosum methylthiophilus]KYC58351.1 MAG: 4-oxalocrotonate tautomerase [Candidatus Methanofastidiosum methylthiophilus]
MPFVEIYLWRETSDELKKEMLIKEVSKKVSEITGAPLDAVEILITEIPKANWGKGGIPASKWQI